MRKGPSSDSKIWTNLFPSKPTKSELTQIKITKGTVRCLAKIGTQRITYDDIAKESKVSRSLVKNYFPSLEELYFKTLQMCWVRYQNYVVERMKPKSTPLNQLKQYLEACFEYLNDEEVEIKAFLYLYYFAAVSKKFQKLNSDATLIGQERISELIKKAKEKKEVRPDLDSMEVAKYIQTFIVGAVFSSVAEQNPWSPSKTHRVFTNSLFKSIARPS